MVTLRPIFLVFFFFVTVHVIDARPRRARTLGYKFRLPFIEADSTNKLESFSDKNKNEGYNEAPNNNELARDAVRCRYAPSHPMCFGR
ncbi:unnamed protein product [Porites lobata]|uniref:Uncharacterized protein n=1 Tax=Porites lobata TaxID=104759 RepID=A0ABN8R6Q6_9CNID|nr:unnamed protein product [Porites lobata]